MILFPIQAMHVCVYIEDWSMVCLLDNPFNRQCFMEDKIMGCSRKRVVCDWSKYCLYLEEDPTDKFTIKIKNSLLKQIFRIVFYDIDRWKNWSKRSVNLLNVENLSVETSENQYFIGINKPPKEEHNNKS